MSAQQILLIIGIVLIVVAVALVGVAIWVYRAFDIKGVRDDLSGVARAREVDSSRTSGGRRPVARAFSDATWGGAVRKSAPAAPSAAGPMPPMAPPQPAPAQGWAAPQAAPPGGFASPPGVAERPDAPTTLLDAGDGDAVTTLLGENDDGTTLLDTGPVEAQPSGSFEFRVVRSEMGAGSSRRIEE